MLPMDVEAHKKAMVAKAAEIAQSSLDPHLTEKPPCIIPYSDKLFRDAAIEWLVSTDQV